MTQPQTTQPHARPDVPAALAALNDLLDQVSDPQAWRLTDEQVREHTVAAYETLTRMHAVGLRLLADLDARKLAEEGGATSTRVWLKNQMRLRPETAKREVELARLIGPAPQTGVIVDTEGEGAVSDHEADVGAATGVALAQGRINVEQAACVVRALHELPEDVSEQVRRAVEDTMIAQADQHDPVTLTRLGHRILEYVDPDAAERRLADQLEREEREARRKRSATRHTDGHGSVYYKVRLPRGDDAIIAPVLDALARPAPAAGGVRDERSADQRRADAFVEAFRLVNLQGKLSSNGGDRPRVVVTMSLETLAEGVGAASVVDAGEELSPATARRLACDAQIIPAVLGGQGEVLDLGRARRTFDGPARLAVILRDGGCVHPGCDRPARWCDVHHRIPWWAGGRTDRNNGVLLCGFHHRLYDDAAWGIQFAADGIPEAIPPKWIDAEQNPIRHPRFLLHQRKPRDG